MPAIDVKDEGEQMVNTLDTNSSNALRVDFSVSKRSSNADGSVIAKSQNKRVNAIKYG
jgi:hypothetical protein